MCCFAAILVLLGPRLAIIVWGIAQPARWEATFSTFVWPLLGFLVLPWTTLMYVAVAPLGVTGFDWFGIALAVIADIASYSGSAWGNRARIQHYTTTYPPVPR
jgi:hypothetical protein